MRMPLAILFASLFVAAPVLAQQPPPTPPTAPPAAQAPQPPQGQNRPQAPSSYTNIKLDLTITDTYADKPSSRNVSMIVVDRERSSIRTENRLPNGGPSVQLNVDAYATLLADRGNRILVRLTFEYTPAQTPAGADGRGPVPAQLTESLSVVLENGQKLVVSQSADPVTDRKVTVEVTATVLK